VGVSTRLSLPLPAVTDRLLTVHVCPLPLVSVPSAAAVLLSEKGKVEPVGAVAAAERLGLPHAVGVELTEAGGV
jgi:hypothetical protein